MTPPKTKAAPAKTLAALRENMIKRYGDGRVSRRSTVLAYETIPTGSLSLDLATRVGGWVRGRLHEIVGQEGQGKTTLCISSMVQAQQKYPKLQVGYIDIEQTWDWGWAEANGLDTSDERFLHVFPDDSEDVSDQLKLMIETGLFSLICVDSIGGMESKQAFQKEADEQVMGRNAQIITRMVKRVAVEARKHQVAVLMVNQFRANLSNPQGGDQSAGPKAFKYSTTMRVEMRGTGESPLKVKFPDEDEPQIVGRQVRARVTRNKVAAQGKKGEFWIINQPSMEYGPIGIDQANEALTIGIYAEVITVEGGGYHTMPWTKTRKDRICGKPSVLAFLRSNPDKAREVRDAAVAKMSADVIADVETEFDPLTGALVEESAS